MRKWILFTMLLLGTLFVSAQQSLSTDTQTISRLLTLAKKQPPTTNFPLFFARQFDGRPYVAHTLEVNDDERLVLNTRELDCTTLVENVAALTLCVYRHRYTVSDFKQALTELRYRQGILDGYCSRLHYFTDWIIDNQELGLVEEIQSPNPPFSGAQKVHTDYMSKHPQAYKALKNHPSLVENIRQQEKNLTGLQFRYIPKRSVGNTAIMRQAVHDGDIIAITCSKPGLDIAHLGFAVGRKDGLHLLNASQLHKRVLEEPMTLYNYLQKHPSHTGIRIIRIKH
jgi:hypothetical protein